MLRLALTNIYRRPLRSILTAAGITVAAGLLLLIDQLAASYRERLLKELNGMGVHLMLVPLGCPYDAAARVLKGSQLEASLPETALDAAKTDPDVALAAPLLIAAVPRPDQGRTDMFVGLDEDGIALKSWWKAARGSARFEGADAVILGADAAQLEMREPGDALYSPETGRTFKVAGVLEHSGTSDDSLFFVPLRTAQAMFNSPRRITAAGIRLKDPAQLSAVSARLQQIPGAQVVTQTEMLGTFLNILGTVRTLLQAVGWVALCASVAGLLNTLLMSVAERSFEFSLFRALGASRVQIFNVVALESVLLTMGGVAGGVLASWALASIVSRSAADYLPFMKLDGPGLRPSAAAHAAALGVAAALAASVFPALRAIRSEPAEALKS